MDEVAEELDEEEQAAKVLSQYECDQCGEEHYHTKKNVSNCKIKKFWNLVFKAAVIEHPGYQFADPCPPSMRGVNLRFLLFRAVTMKSLKLQLHIQIVLEHVQSFVS